MTKISIDWISAKRTLAIMAKSFAAALTLKGLIIIMSSDGKCPS